MKYRVTCLTPTLVGDGSKLSPIDYMVWRDQVNVLDQNRIFRLLSKGPRLEGYLTQLRKAGLVLSERRGMNVFHRVRPEALQSLCAALDPNCCT